MTLKLIGAIMIIGGCGGVGMSMAAAHRNEERGLQQLICALEYMRCELQYRLTPLPALCRGAAAEGNNAVTQVFLDLANTLETKTESDVFFCMKEVLERTPKLPQGVNRILLQLGAGLGKFDLQGQLEGLTFTQEACSRELNALTKDRDVRLRSYKTLGFCAGCALAILFL